VNLISLDGVSKTLGESPLFEGVSLGIDDGDKIGFVGRNGRGKSTFLRILSGDLEPDSGTLARKRSSTVSFLSQRTPVGDETAADFLFSGESTAAALAAAMREFHAGGDDRSAEKAHKELEAAGGARLELDYSSICTELGLTDLRMPMASMSGGMAKKAAIARALAPRADLLLLDEPTNHLDIDTIEWLERRLASYPGAFVLVTHDRWFLDSVCTSVMEIDRRSIYKYPGGFSDHLRRRLEREAALEQAESRRLAVLKTELAWLARGARARATKSERRKDVIRDMQAQALEREASMEGFTALGKRLGKKILALKGISKSYGAKAVVASYSRDFKAGERIGLVGPNGSGKTTFLDLVSGRIATDSGRVDIGENTHFAYFDQTAASLDLGATILGHIRERAERIPMADGSVLSPEQFLERFLFPRAMHDLTLGRLSGGELRRLQLVRLLAESPNFLLLDEPTNDLDIDTIELLEDFLAGFPGCVLAVSHDRAFLDRLADSILAFDGSGGVKEYVGSYAEFRSLGRKESGPSGAEESRGAPLANTARDGEPRKRKAGLRWSERRELEDLLEEISALEGERSALETLFSGSSPDPESIVRAKRRYAELGALIEAKSLRWEELAAREALE